MQGVAAIDAILTMTPDTPSPMIGMNGNAITQLPLVDCVEQVGADRAGGDRNRSTSADGRR